MSKEGEFIGGSVATFGRLFGVAVQCHPTPGAVGQSGNELRKSSQCALKGEILVGYDATTLCEENVGGLNSMNNGVMTNILTNPQYQDSAAVTTKKVP